jgi:hypothetical protein
VVQHSHLCGTRVCRHQVTRRLQQTKQQQQQQRQRQRQQQQQQQRC